VSFAANENPEMIRCVASTAPPDWTSDTYTVTAEAVVLHKDPVANFTDWAAATVYTAASAVPNWADTKTFGVIDDATSRLSPGIS